MPPEEHKSNSDGEEHRWCYHMCWVVIVGEAQYYDGQGGHAVASHGGVDAVDHLFPFFLRIFPITFPLFPQVLSICEKSEEPRNVGDDGHRHDDYQEAIGASLIFRVHVVQVLVAHGCSTAISI